MELNRTLIVNPDQRRDSPESHGTSNSEVPVENSSMEVGTPDKEDSHWTTVQHRRARSHGSLPDKRTFSTEQVKTIKLAAERMTLEQRQQIKRCQEKIQTRHEGSASSRGEGDWKSVV